MNHTLQTIADRRSIRAYEPTPVADADLRAIMNAALQSPSGMNRQPWHFTVVTDRALLDEFDAAHDPNASLTYRAPAVIFVTVPVNRAELSNSADAYVCGRDRGIDCGIAVQNMALAAWSLGYGNVILGMPRAVFEGERGPEFMERFGIPEGHEFIIALAVGKAAKGKDAHELHPEKVHYVGQ
ncbi:MAG: nitroreductase [Clostridia bacterium]|nr:nitroreductase [Clostridia bacterium]